MIIDRLKACDVELTGKFVGALAAQVVSDWKCKGAADGQTGRGLGRVSDNAVLGDGEASIG